MAPLIEIQDLKQHFKIKGLDNIAKVYVSYFRGTPLLIQLFLFYYGLPMVLDIMKQCPKTLALILCLGLNSAAYISESIRGAIDSIDKGQYEASKVLGFSKAYTFFHIILPQVIKRILPALGNEVITLVKDTALAQTIGVAELFRVAQTASSREFSTVPIFIAGIFYFVMNYIVSRLFVIGERKLDYYR